MNEELDTSGAVAAYLQNGVQADPARGARASMTVAVGANPDYEAELRDVSRRTGVPVESVRAFPDETKRQAQVGAIDFGALSQQFPKTAAFLSGVDNARVAHDDVNALSQTEKLFQEALASGRAAQGKVDGPAYTRSGSIQAVERSWWQGITEPVQRGLAQGRRGLTLLFNELGVFDGLQRQRDAARAAAGLPPEGNAELAVRLANQQREIDRYPVPDDIARGMQEISGATTMGYALEAALSNPRAVIETTLQSLGASAPALVGAAAGSVAGPVGTATGAGLGSFAVEYSSTLQDVMSEKGVNASDPMSISSALSNPELMAAARDKAVKRGIPIAIFDALTAGLAGRLLAGAKPTALSVGGRAAGELGLQAGGGAAGEATAQAATGEYKPGDILMEALAEVPTAIVEVPGNYRSALARAQVAEQGARTVEQINELAKASKLAQRDPATFEAFVTQASEGGPVQDVFINAQTLAQSGVAEQIAAVSPAVAEQLPTALATGGDIKIPVAEYAARIAPTEYAQGLLDHLKTEPQGMSRAEAQEFMQSQAEVLKAEVEKVLAEKQGDDTFKAQADEVKAQVRQQLDQVGRFTGQVNDAYASMVSNFYAVMAAKLGISPQDLFSRYPLKVAAERITGDQVLEQGAGTVFDWSNPGGGSRAAKVGDSTIIYGYDGKTAHIISLRTPSAKRNKGSARAAMAQFLRETDALAIPVKLESSPLDKRTKDARLFNFYKSLGFEPTGKRVNAVGDPEMLRQPQQTRAQSTYTQPTSEVDGVTRPTTNSNGNVGTFDPQDPNILKQGTGNRGSFNPATNTITLLKNADLSTFLHESGHFFLEVLADLASQPNAPQQIVDDMATILKWFGIKGDEQVGGSDSGAPLAQQDAEAVSEAIYKEMAADDELVAALEAWMVDGTQPDAATNEKLLGYMRRMPPVPRDSYLTFYRGQPRGVAPHSRGWASWTTNPDTTRFFTEGDSEVLQRKGVQGISLEQIALWRTRLTGELTDYGSQGEWLVLNESVFAQGGDLPTDTTKPAGRTPLEVWNAMTLDQKRPYHERWAESFEQYLFEGKAPSIELQGLFQRFRAWLLNVYRELKNLNVELTDEVRGVFDRMLATTDEIKLAEQGRSMMPLFTSPEQAGMTTEEFAAYQALGVDATNDAIQDLQARGLRDLAWTRNARGREIKRLQKEAAARRAEVQIEVRRDVMSQPVYRAWQFLTGKLSADDKAAVAPIERPKSKPGPVDESVDSLAVAIAKLGGIDRAQAESQWGVDPKERSPMPIFGKYLLRREGGLSIDAMGEALSQYGYLSLDEDGRYDLRELEEKFGDELRGAPHYSNAVDPTMFAPEPRPGEGITTENVGAGRLDLVALKSLGIPDEIIEHVQNLKMTAKDGIHPDLVAEMFGFSSGDELVRTLAAAQDPKTEIEGLTDARMLERYGELATPAAIEREADKAIHNDARARFVATEANALAKATGKPKVLASAAREFARAMIARLKVRDIRPGQYANAEVRAANAAEKASKAGDLATAAAEKRNQLVNNYATRAAYDAQEEVEKGLRYLKKFDGDIKALDADYADQIGALLERFDLRKQSLKAIDKRAALAEWIKSMREQGLEPEIPPALENEAFRKSYRDLTVEEFRGLVDTVKQIEHLGRLKNRLLTAADNRAFEAVKTEIVQSIEANAVDREADTRTPITNLGRALQQVKRFYSAHIKAATWARILDGGKDGGPMWEYFVRSANERGDMETTMRAEATTRLSEILAPVFKLGKMGGKGQFFASINRSLNREARIALALNTGNQGNLQRLLGGEGWTVQQIAPVLQSLTAAEWRAVQAVWDYFESYRPQIEAKERRVYGRSPEWVEPAPFNIKTADGEELALRGGYYPIKYDPAASQRAEEHADAEGAKRQLQGAYTTATTRRSFTKTRAEEVSGRPLLYTLAGLYSGVNDVIHDLAWHEWLIDANRLLRSKSIDAAIRNHYGPEVKAQFKSWAADIAEGDKAADNAGEVALSRLRQGISAAGLGFNAMSAALQVLGFTQSIVRVGPTWVGKGIARYVGSPLGTAREVNAKSEFMANRSRTRFRELNELRNKVQDESDTMRHIKAGTYFLMMRAQQMVDVPTWIGAYEKALAAGNEEERAIALADQAVIDAQGGGQTKDLAAIERGGPAMKLFTVFYSFMNTAFNLGVGQTMTAKSKAKLAADYLLIFVVPAVLGSLLKDALTPGGGDDEDLDKLAKKLAAEQLSYLMGMMVVVREFSFAAKTIVGAEGGSRDYTGPAGLRLISDAGALVKQASQGEFDDAFRKAAINVVGDLTGLPSAQVNRTITGAQALAEGETENPAAVVFGFQRRR